MGDLLYDLDNASQVDNQPKAIYSGDSYSGQPVIAVLEEGVYLAGSKTQVISITEEFGIRLAGKISLGANPDSISIAGGYWRLNPLLLSCLPSTSATPIPVLVRSQPELLQNADALTNCLSILGSNGL